MLKCYYYTFYSPLVTSCGDYNSAAKTTTTAPIFYDTLDENDDVTSFTKMAEF